MVKISSNWQKAEGFTRKMWIFHCPPKRSSNMCQIGQQDDSRKLRNQKCTEDEDEQIYMNLKILTLYNGGLESAKKYVYEI